MIYLFFPSRICASSESQFYMHATIMYLPIAVLPTVRELDCHFSFPRFVPLVTACFSSNRLAGLLMHYLLDAYACIELSFRS